MLSCCLFLVCSLKGPERLASCARPSDHRQGLCEHTATFSALLKEYSLFLACFFQKLSRSMSDQATTPAPKQKKAAAPAAAKTEKPPAKPKDPMSMEPALGVNRAYDEALKWFNGQRSGAQSRVELAEKEISSVNTARATLEARNAQNPGLAMPQLFQSDEDISISMKIFFFRSEPGGSDYRAAEEPPRH